MRRPRARSLGILRVGHDLHEVFHLADRFAVMKGGLTAGADPDAVVGMSISGRCSPGVGQGSGAAA